MIVSIIGDGCFVYREPEDPKFRPNRSKLSWSSPGWYGAESRLLYNVQRLLNERGYDLLKKRMWKDGHMWGSEETQYVRSRNLKNFPSIYVYHTNAALEVAAESYNVLGRVRLDVVYGAGREDDPDYERACRDWVATREAALPCYQVAWKAEVTIDGYSTIRRLYRGFTKLERAEDFIKSEPGDSCHLIDRRSGKPVLAHEFA